MKIITAALLAALLSTSAAAQDFTPAAGFSATTLFDAGIGTFGGFDTDSSGNIYYLDGTTDTQLLRVTPGANFGDPTPVADFGTFVYGNFVKVVGTTAYYGESSTNGIYASSTAIIQPTPTPVSIATVPGNYDFGISGSSGYVSANGTFTDNQVYQLNLSTGITKAILDTQGDASGPIAFKPEPGQPVGDLIYGATIFGQSPTAPQGGIYFFPSAKVQAALSSGTPMKLSDGTEIFANSGNQYLFLDGNDLYQAVSPFGAAATLTLYNLATQTSTLIGATPINDYFSGMTFSNGMLDVAVSDASGDTTVVQVIPEPGGLGLAALGAAGLAFGARRGRRSRTT